MWQFLAGKSAIGRNRKYYYYSHTKGNSLFVETGKKCRFHRLKAEIVEEMVLNFMKNKITDSKAIEKMIRDYEKQSIKESPKVHGQLLSVKKELKSLNTKLENLSVRLSEIPCDIPAVPIYQQMRKIKEKREKLLESEIFLNEEILQKSHLKVDKEAFTNKLNMVATKLDKSEKKDHRSIYQGIIDFIEIYPEKLRMGIYAPSLAYSNYKSGSTNVLLGARDRT